jgi:Na+-translocating ferredoxin:NAD+ oxidoreductase RnfG subunit
MTLSRRQFVVRVVRGTGAVALTSLPSFAQIGVYLNEEQAIKLVFPSSERVSKESKELSAQQQAQIEQKLRLRLDGPQQQIYRGETAGKTDGYAMIVNEIGKEQFITFIVGITPEFRVKKVALMVFRETRGAEVEDQRFTNQFRGKSARDPLQIDADIIGITGATLSSRAFCRGTKKALLICQTLYGK